ncbi:3-methyladenine DNA glycosylase [Gordonia liuliyuniae]|uniref:3-methyladenine DNA glycosylase n=1 Tax=Gordonia liuliyuniae TaxID=2911517 RepID=A0ABS9IQA8_9ACTN|nr:3-methyladenine DNA glycosylase [Gordonia liuliyuniae]MCF8587739.1 3-methyladenine DNA glycosylase [Gordonia liuliyuniae]
MGEGGRVLDRTDWTARARAHSARIEALIGPYLRARRAGGKHPVIDFLFTYYSARPAQLTRWHPGYGTVLLDAAEYDGMRGYRVDGAAATVSDEHLTDHSHLVAGTLRILEATASRPPRLGCFGLHEWAMVYRTGEKRHPHPLRLGAAGTDAVVEESRLLCTHFDAFRFFTDASRPRNSMALTRADTVANEQPGCLHATMDLYRYCLRLSPLVGSDLLADCFDLALTARELDMRASPYDLSGVRDAAGRPYVAVPVETADGRAQYVSEQTDVARRGSALRDRVIDVARTLDEASQTAGDP